CAPVVWIGRRGIDVRRHPAPDTVWPIRILCDAVAQGVPRRDLLVSPDHAIFLDGVLIPARCLVNGATIFQDRTFDHVSYFHVELPAHDVLLAEGLPAESWLDTGNRADFENHSGLIALHPRFAPRTWEHDACAPLTLAGPALAAARGALLARAASFGFERTDDPALVLSVDGRTVPPAWQDGATIGFVLPDGARTAVLTSRVAVPAEIDESTTDRRRLGVAVTSLALDHIHIAADDSRRVRGWHAPEAGWQWTDGAAAIACSGACI